MTGSSGTPVTAAAATEVVSDPWRVLADKLVAAYKTGSMVRGGEFVAKIIDAAEVAGHHPDIDLRYGTVHLVLTTHSAHALTEADVALANTIAAIAVDLGIEPAPTPMTQFDLAIDALDIAAIRPFWAAVFGYKDAAEHQPIDLVDPDGRLPGVWFQQMDEARPQRSRMHVDLWVPHDELEHRLQSALEAGGRLLTDEYAPSFWVLADAEGNEVCLCTWQERAD
ncbi:MULTISPECIES: VOC family protein [unclassified Gordonia (in: high G+C Gram-positive bacteria)]|uniref:VOC family protein n=1 Tax=unclassified Gordonia (in: high G+C Gram-positive bacteria) TaxID=2657482 RepID=UPI001F0F4E76|nr:VOC family protein [Gordonia sp. ABSL49_1]MCH5641657.1 4a-hydroxytetrahydrobiopterin dehydratase [Gordonia sp. ABSL49_1]